MSDITASLLALLESPLAEAHFELVDIECVGLGTAAAAVRIYVELAQSHPIGGRIDLEGVAAATRVIDAMLEEDRDPVPGRYTLEVSSPGLERPLRTPEHFRRAVGTTISVKTKPGTPGERRVEGRLDSASLDPDEGIEIGGRRIPYAFIEKARVVVQWGPPPKPGKGAPVKRKPHPMAAAAAAASGPVAAGAPGSSDDDEDDEFEDLDDDLADDELDDVELNDAFDDDGDVFDDDDEFDDDELDTPDTDDHDQHEGDDQ